MNNKPIRRSLKHVLIALSIAVGLGQVATASAIPTWTATGNMTAARVAHTATLLNNGKVLVAGGYDSLSASLASASWIQLSPTGGPPPPRGNGSNRANGYDATNNRMMFFGGYTSPGTTLLNDTWVLVNADGAAGTPQWMQLSTVNTPAPHRHHAGAYDAVNNRLIVYGGCLGQCTPLDPNVYVLSNANGLGSTPTWTQLSTSGGSPPLRDSHTAVYDPTSNRLIVFGGDNCCGGRFNDTWVLSNANGLGGTPVWTQLLPSGGTPPGRAGHSAVYDSTNNRMMIIFGGGSCGTLCNDVWVLANANGLGGTPTWTQLSPSGTPPTARTAAMVAYDPATNRMVVFGGYDNNLLNDVWMLTNANSLGGTPTWTQLTPTGTAPTPRSASNAGYNPVSNRLIIFGGQDASGYLNDVWVLTSALPQPLPIDVTAPVVNVSISSPNGQNGWFVTSPVIGSVTADDTTTDGSNITAINCTGATIGTIITSLGTPSASASLTVSGEGVNNVNCTATDSAGNSGAGPGSSNMATVQIDSFSPTILITSPTDGGTYTLNAAVASGYSCDDGTSGVATCAGPVASGANFSTSPVGAHTFTVTATDVAGNPAQATNDYDVIYNFNGFFQPVDNLPTLNVVKAGQAIPVKFSLNGDQGLNIFAAGYPRSQNIECVSTTVVDGIEVTVTAESSGLSYDPNTDTYTYVWKTNKTWANTCRQLVVKLNDGTEHVAYFKFK